MKYQNSKTDKPTNADKSTFSICRRFLCVSNEYRGLPTNRQMIYINNYMEIKHNNI